MTENLRYALGRNWAKFCLSTVCKEFFSTEKEYFKEDEKLRIEQKHEMMAFYVTAIKKDLTTPIIKHANELKAHEKTVRTIKLDLCPNLNLLDYAKCGILEKKTNETSDQNIRFEGVMIQ